MFLNVAGSFYCREQSRAPPKLCSLLYFLEILKWLDRQSQPPYDLYFVMRESRASLEMCGAKLVVILLLSGLSLSLAALPLSQEVEVVRCAKAGLVFLPGNRSCYQPLTTGPCGPGLMVVLDTESMVGRCEERKCEDLDMVWDEGRGQCGDIYKREVRQRQLDMRALI